MSYIGSTPTTQSFIAGTDYFNGTGSAVSFTMSRAVNSVNDIEVIVNNVEQIPSGYSVSGTTLTFSAAPSAGTSNVYVRYLSTTNLSLAIPSGTSATFNTIAATTLGVTGVATFAAGTAALPAITTTGDTNTGIFFPAADTIAFAEGGAEAMRIDSSGNVGIGTASPSTRLAVSNSAGGNVAGFTNTSSADLNINLTSGVTLLTPSTGTLAFGTSSTERARIDSSGNLLVGTTAQFNSCKQALVFDGSVNIGFAIKNSNVTIGQVFTGFYNSAGTNIGTITQNATTTVSYATSSDYRLKENVAPMTSALSKVALLKPVTYTWKQEFGGELGQGFIAHELQEVVPECVTGKKDAVDAEGNPQYQGIDTSFLVATLTAAIQEQQALITALTTRITALENNNATQ